MPLLTHAAPKPVKVRLPSLYGGPNQPNVLQPKATAENYYTPTAPVSYGVNQTSLFGTNVTPSSSDQTDAIIQSATGAAPSGTDYKQALANDADLSTSLGVIQARIDAQNTTRQNAARRAAIQFGGIPQLDEVTANMAGLGPGSELPWDEQTNQLIAAANASGVSTMAMDQKAYENAQSQYLSSLAARGMLRSGALGQHANETELAFQQNVYRDTQAVGDYLIGLWQTYLGELSQGNDAKAAAVRTALDRILANIQAANAAKAAAEQAAQAEHDRQVSIGFTGEPGVNPNTGYGIPADPYTPRDMGGFTDVNPRFVSAAQQGYPVDPYPDFPQPPEYGVNGWGSGQPSYIDTGAPSYDYGQYAQSGGQEYYQSLRGPYGRKPLL